MDGQGFLNDPKDFQFAIVSDRTGGPRAGVFPRAVEKLNLLRPEFVITVGDLIQGGAGNRNVEKLMGQWKEFNSFIQGFDMPSFICRETMTWEMKWPIKFGMICLEFVIIHLYTGMFFFYVSTPRVDPVPNPQNLRMNKSSGRWRNSKRIKKLAGPWFLCTSRFG